jgi:hypothetical protein
MHKKSRIFIWNQFVMKAEELVKSIEINTLEQQQTENNYLLIYDSYGPVHN